MAYASGPQVAQFKPTDSNSRRLDYVFLCKTRGPPSISLFIVMIHLRHEVSNPSPRREQIHVTRFGKQSHTEAAWRHTRTLMSRPTLCHPCHGTVTTSPSGE